MCKFCSLLTIVVLFSISGSMRGGDPDAPLSDGINRVGPIPILPRPEALFPSPPRAEFHALHFDGRSGSYVTIPNVDMRHFTFATRVKRDVTGKKQYVIMSTRFGGWGVFFSETPGEAGVERVNNYVWFTHRGAGDWHSDAEITDNKWHFVAVTLDGSSLNFYIDGKPSGSASMGYTIDSQDDSYGLGGAPELAGDAGCNLEGSLRGTLIFNRPLNPSEIAQLHNQGRSTDRLGKMPGLVAGYHFDEGHGTTVADFASHEYSGTLNGGVTWTKGTVPVPNASHIGAEVVFDGTDYVGLGNPPDKHLDLGATATIETWVRFDALHERALATLLSKDEGPFDRNKWIFAYAHGNPDGVNATIFHINSSQTGGIWLHSHPWTPVLGRWYHLAIVKNGNQYTFYRNGIPDGTATSTAEVPHVNFDLLLGQSEGGNRLQGAMSDVRLWNTAVGADQIKARMNTEVSEGETGLVGHWFHKAKPSQPAASALGYHALQFDGTGYATLPPSLKFTAHDFTVSLWFNPTATNKFQFLFMRGFAWADKRGDIGLKINRDSGELDFQARTSDEDWLFGWDVPESRLRSAFRLNQWNHVVVTRHGDTYTMWMNGVNAGSQVSVADIADTDDSNPFIVGGMMTQSGVQDMFQGSLAEVLVYRTALAQEDVNALYQGGCLISHAPSKYPHCQDLVAGYRFDEVGGMAINDFTGHGNMGTLQGGVTRVEK